MPGTLALDISSCASLSGDERRLCRRVGKLESGVTGLITEAQFSQAADAVLLGLAAQGLADAEARDLLGPALTPTALDLLAVLAEP